MREFWLDLKIKIKSYFVFTHGEKRGTIILLLIICLLSAAILWVNYRPRPATDFTDFYKAIAELKAQQSVATEDSLTVEMQDSLKVFSSRKAAKQELFPFDPNNASAEEWNKLGLSNKQIHVIQNYISHGGHFYKKEDLLKIYSISNETYKRLESYININENEKQAVKPFDTTNNASNNKGIKNKIAQPLLDINTATQEQLESLQGVGKWIATNIIKYREKLGGYFDASQLLEVRYINDSVYQIIQPQVKVNTVYLRKINLNTNEFKSLLHPYLDYNMARAISAYRKMHGDFKSVDDLKNIKAIAPATFEKLKPYLSIANE